MVSARKPGRSGILGKFIKVTLEKKKGFTMYTNNLTGHKYASRLDWLETMAVGSGDLAKSGNVSDSAVATFIFGDGMMIAKESDGMFYSIVCNEEFITDDSRAILDWLWEILYTEEGD